MNLTDTEMLEMELLLRQDDVDSGVSDFWEYCKLTSPRYYRDDKPHLKILCTVLQNFYEGKLIRENGKSYKKLMINIPPRHGKTRTLTKFSQWILGKNPFEKIIVGSYNDDTAGDFSKYTRDGIEEKRNVETGYVFNDFFPDTQLKFGTNSYYKWALEGQFFNYLGAGIGGSITGKGGSILLIDDPIKNELEAFNEDKLQKIWNWYTGTFLSRGDTEGRNAEDLEIAAEPFEIVTMTRWCNQDICGRILSSDEAKEWYQVVMKAYDKDTDTMLCERTLSRTRYEDLQKKMIPEVFWANYLQETIDTKGRLYKEFKTYDELPIDKDGKLVIEGIYNYTDTADEGSDFLCSICYAQYKGEAYIVDLLYTKEGMESTEPKTAQLLNRNKVNKAVIESNNGGRGFARNVQRILKDELNNTATIIDWFHQSENKIARILTHSSFVQEHIYFPVNWKDRFPEFYKSMSTFLKEGKNQKDDAQDCITGVAERIDSEKKFEVLFGV